MIAASAVRLGRLMRERRVRAAARAREERAKLLSAMPPLVLSVVIGPTPIHESLLNVARTLADVVRAGGLRPGRELRPLFASDQLGETHSVLLRVPRDIAQNVRPQAMLDAGALSAGWIGERP